MILELMIYKLTCYELKIKKFSKEYLAWFEEVKSVVHRYLNDLQTALP